MRPSILLAAASSVSAIYQGFNYGSTQTDGSAKSLADFTAEFTTAKNLVGTSGFSSARLYTMIQAGTTNTPISAIQAAINTQTSLLLGLWASAGQTAIDNEIAALKTAINQYGTAFTSLVAGISIGSEDLYRITPTGIASNAGIGAGPDTLVNYIGQVRQAISGTALSGAKLGHVDTWTAWVNGSNAAVIQAVDWLGFDGYPYFEATLANSIDNSLALFEQSFGATVAVSGGKEVWLTETGWPVSGSVSGAAVPSLANAKTFWNQVGCPRFGKVNTWWFTLQDSFPTTPNPSFGIVGSTLSTTPLYDLSCSSVTTSTSSSVATASSAASSAASATSSAVVSSASSAASVAVSSGGALVPGSGNGVGSSALSVATGASTAAGAVTTTAAANTVATTVATTTAVKPTTGGAGSGSATTSSAVPGFTGAAISNSGSAVGGLVAAIVALLAAF